MTSWTRIFVTISIFNITATVCMLLMNTLMVLTWRTPIARYFMPGWPQFVLIGLIAVSASVVFYHGGRPHAP